MQRLRPRSSKKAVVVVVLSLVPPPAHAAPFALHIAIQAALAVALQAKALVLIGPMPLRAAMLTANEFPVASTGNPATAIPALEDAHAVQISASLLGASPEPAS